MTPALLIFLMLIVVSIQAVNHSGMAGSAAVIDRVVKYGRELSRRIE